MAVRSVIMASITLLGVAFGVQSAGAASVSDPNLLSGIVPTVSSEFTPDYAKENAADGAGGGPGAGNDFVFAAGDATQNASFTGFDSGVGVIRLYFGDLQPKSVAIYSSSTSKTSLLPSDYETTLVSTVTLANPSTPYREFTVSAANGTKSLLFDFGPDNYTQGGNGFSRIQEFQAFAAPEPSSLSLVMLGGVSLLRRKRRTAR